MSDIEVDVGRIMKLLGYNDSNRDPAIENIVYDCLNEASNYFEPKSGVIIFPHSPEPDAIDCLHFEGITIHTKRIVTGQLKRASHFALYMCTIGSKLETLSKEYMRKGDALQAYIFDLIGSEAADSIANHLHQKIRELAQSEALYTTNRFSPGYCEWDVAEQHQLFTLLPKLFCGVTLSESALMHPVKSTNGIIGIGAKVKESPYSCASCTQTECTFRDIYNAKNQ